ncbi:hypothetical protein ACP0HM_22855 [Escherichia coli]
MPPSANLALRGAGDRAVPLGRWSEIWWGFCEYPVNGEGLSWIGYGALITAVPLITVGILARMLAKNELPDHVRDAGRVP